MTDRNLDPVKVHCIDQEYWLIRRSKCACGATLRVRGQRAERRGTLRLDVLETICTGCNRSIAFEFDISSFFCSTTKMTVTIHAGSPEQKDALLKRLVAEEAGGPMERTMAYFKELAASKDDLAFTYLQEALWHFRGVSPTSAV